MRDFTLLPPIATTGSLFEGDSSQFGFPFLNLGTNSARWEISVSPIKNPIPHTECKEKILKYCLESNTLYRM